MKMEEKLFICAANHCSQIQKLQTLIIMQLRKRSKYIRQQKKRRQIMEGLRVKINILSTQVSKWKAPKKFWVKIRTSDFWEKEVQESDDNFFKENFRIDRPTFNKLCIELKRLAKQETRFRKPISLEKRIAVALYSLGSSAEYRTISYLFGIGKSTVCNILREFCEEVWKVLQPKYLNKYPLQESTVRDCVNGFQRMGFPQCLGAIDGCHIEVRPRAEDAVDYFNYKGWYSTVLLALVDYRYRFLYINCGSPGRCNDSQIFERSLLKFQHEKPILKEMSINICRVSVPVLIIGDSAFRFSNMIMKPYPFKISATAAEKNFNYCLSKCRRVVENAFGHLKARFRRIRKGLDNHIDNVNLIIKSACVIHNYLNEHNDRIKQHWIQQLKEQQEKSGRVQPEHSCTLYDNDPSAEKIRTAISKYLAPNTPDGPGSEGTEQLATESANRNSVGSGVQVSELSGIREFESSSVE